LQFASATQQLQALSLNHGLLLQWSKTDTDNAFLASLDIAAQSNATPLFGDLHRKLAPLAQSLPLVIHHRTDICNLLLDCMRGPQFSTVAQVVLESAFRTSPRKAEPPHRLIPALFNTLQAFELLQPFLAPLLHQLQLTLFEAADAKIVDRALHVLAYVFKALGKDLAADYENCWSLVKDAFCGVPTEEAAPAVEEDLDEESDAEASNGPQLTEMELDAPAVDALTEEAELVAPLQPLNQQRIKFQPHVRHLLASAFAYAVRKVPLASFPDFASLVYRSLEAAGTDAATESVAWILAETFASVNYTVYSKSAVQFRAFALAATTPLSRTAVQYALISTLHHTSHEHMQEWVQTILDLSPTHLVLLEILLGLRRGSRIPTECREAVWAVVEGVHVAHEGYERVLVNCLLWATPAENLARGPELFQRLYAAEVRSAPSGLRQLTMRDRTYTKQRE
jgi:hypothetical protein